MQLEFPYASLDFPGRTTVKVHEIATRTGFSEQHILNQIDQGLLVVLDAKSAFTSRRCIRVPIEEYRAWVLKNLTGPATLRNEFLAQLPKPVLRDLQSEIARLISAA
jgi:hypothetical protein